MDQADCRPSRGGVDRNSFFLAAVASAACRPSRGGVDRNITGTPLTTWNARRPSRGGVDRNITGTPLTTWNARRPSRGGVDRNITGTPLTTWNARRPSRGGVDRNKIRASLKSAAGGRPSRASRRIRAHPCLSKDYMFIQHAVWLYFRFPLSYRDVEDLLAERGIDVSLRNGAALGIEVRAGLCPETKDNASTTRRQVAPR